MSFADLVAAVDNNAIALLGEPTPVIYQPETGAAVSIMGIFDDSFLLVQSGDGAGVETRVPTVFLRLADLPIDPMVDDPILTITDPQTGAASDYRVFERRPADFGSIVLALRKVV